MQSGTEVAGRYRLDERLAAGGMGEVWKGFDTRLGRSVAIKILHAGLSDNDKFRARFQLEARAVAALQSPGIVALYDYGEEESEDGTLAYLVMELVTGRSLAEILRERGPLPPAEVMRIVSTAADALEVAHRADIIHRDIKPANLLVDEETGAVKIVDFGIAAARGASGLTETGTVMGTLAYASPEQLNGQEATGATDLYSLGVVAYEALMGQPPFVSDTPVAVMSGHMHQAPPPLNRDIPPGVAQVVLQALQKDPGARYTSAADMARSAREGRVVTGGIPVTPSTPPEGAMGAGATRTMGAVGDTTSPQPTNRLEQAGESRGRAVPWLITGAVTLAVALIVSLIWLLGQDDDSGDINPAEEETSSEAPTESESPTEEETTEEDDTSNWEPTTEEPTTEEPTTEEPTTEEPTTEEPTDEEPTDEEPTDEEPTDEEPTDSNPTTENENTSPNSED
ncbi:serine/threonine-protein kinase [Glycomyces salinus]|uniref:serine/threonine-protein kinase n=1 Tax=Glycomyces salinus TaxID=980294 RepID=UPI0027DA3D3C|nr:serine/threonine-protein kinase [Glycomyces salinus]